MKFSLINVQKESGNKVSGYWIQDHVGTVESAKKLAKDTNVVNGNKLNIAIVNQVSNTTPLLDYFENLEKINSKQVYV